MKTAFYLLALLLPAGSVACSSSSAASSTDADAHASSTDAGQSDDGPPPCNDVAASAPLVNYSLSSEGQPPADMGGTIADGTYYLTGYTIYAGGSVGAGYVANQATSLTLVVAGSSWTQVQTFKIEGTTDTVTANYTASTIGAALTLTPTCPAGPAITESYTATATAIQLDTVDDFPLSETLVKQ
jgi:hypothetical protein